MTDALESTILGIIGKFTFLSPGEWVTDIPGIYERCKLGVTSIPGERDGSVVKRWTPERGGGRSKPHSAVLCP